MKILSSLLLPFIYFTLSNITTCIITKKKFGYCLPITFMLNIIVIYISQYLIHSFNPGYIILLIYAAFAIIFFIVSKNKNVIKENVISSGFYLFSIFYLLSFCILLNKYFNQYDELMHWGTMVKEMLINDKFYTDVSSTLMYHKDYPPFMSLLEMIWCKIALSYSESNVTQALHTFMFSLVLFPFVELNTKNDKNNIIKNTLFCLITILLILHFDVYNLFSSIYLELVLPALFAYNFYLIIKEGNNISNKITILLSSVTILMSKQIGVAFLGLLILTYLLKNIVYNKNRNIKEVIFLVLLIIIPTLFYLSWNIYISQFTLFKQFSMDNTLTPNEIFGSAGFGKTIIRLFVSSLFNTNLINNLLNLSYVGCTILFIAIIYYIFIYKNYKKLQKNDVKILVIVFSVGTIFYMLMMLFLYLFIFKDESLKMASFNRYMSSYILTEFLSLYLVLYKDIKEKLDIKKVIMVLFIMLITLNNKSLQNFIPCISRGNTFKDQMEHGIRIKQKTPSKSNILVISTKRAHDDVLIHYYSDDRFFVYTWDDYVNNDYLNKSDNYRLDNQLFSQDYIYIVDKSKSFEKHYRQYLMGTKKFKKNKVYKILNNDTSKAIMEVE